MKGVSWGRIREKQNEHEIQRHMVDTREGVNQSTVNAVIMEREREREKVSEWVSEWNTSSHMTTKGRINVTVTLLYECMMTLRHKHLFYFFKPCECFWCFTFQFTSMLELIFVFIVQVYTWMCPSCGNWNLIFSSSRYNIQQTLGLKVHAWIPVFKWYY